MIPINLGDKQMSQHGFTFTLLDENIPASVVRRMKELFFDNGKIVGISIPNSGNLSLVLENGEIPLKKDGEIIVDENFGKPCRVPSRMIWHGKIGQIVRDPHGNLRYRVHFELANSMACDCLIGEIEMGKNELLQKSGQLAVWLTRHNPTPEQRAYLENRGFTIKTLSELATVEGDEVYKFSSGQHAWEIANRVAGRQLGSEDVVIGVFPINMLPDYLRVCGKTPLLRAEMQATTRDDGKAEYEWTGKFSRTVRVEIVTEEWE